MSRTRWQSFYGRKPVSYRDAIPLKKLKPHNPLWIPKKKWFQGKAEEMRRDPSHLESLMIEILNEMGVDYNFQVPWRKRYILDFWIPRGHINIECDGVQFHKNRKDQDRKRDDFLRNRSKMKILRFPSYAFKDRASIIKKISHVLPRGYKIKEDFLTQEFKKVIS